jgi:hypothetical protein
MIWTYLILFLASLVTGLLKVLHLQPVTTLPNILGVDVDAALVNGVSLFHTFITVFWPVYYMFIGALFILGYVVLKNIVLRFFLGHRAPGT